MPLLRIGAAVAVTAAWGCAAALAAAHPAAAPARVAAVRVCTSQQLHLHYRGAASVATVTRVALAYTNVSTRRCALSGWPRVLATDSTGRTRPAIRTGMLPTFQPELRDESTPPGVPAVVLAHGQSAYSFLAADGISANSTKACPKYIRLAVALPRSARSVSLSGWVAGSYNRFIPACDRLAVSQILPRAAVRFFGR